MNNRRLILWLLIVALTALSLAMAAGCTSDDDDDDDVTDDDDDDDDNDDDQTDPGDPIEPTAGYLERQAEYLAYCSAGNGPGEGGIHGQVCRLAMDAQTLDEQAIDNSCQKIDERLDCSDFDLNSILRMLYLFRDHPTLSDETCSQLEQTVLNFKYWLDEPGDDDVCWWSENHQILYHTAELLAGQLFYDEVFPNSGMTGADHVAHALPLLQRWLELRGRIGFVEWHSNVYFNEDIPALVNLVDFAQDEQIALRASMLLDLLAFDFANNYYRNLYATTHGRTYQNKLIEGSRDSTNEAAYVMLGLADYQSDGNFAAVALATSTDYWPPALLEPLAADARLNHEARERDGIDVIDGPDYGIGYTDHEDVMFWWGMGAYAEHHVMMGTLQLVEDFDMWDGWLWSDISFLRLLVGSPLLPVVAEIFDDLTRGPALETINTYTFRTPYYQLSGAQDFKKGMWGAQAHIWQATIDFDARVFTSYPGGMAGDYMAGEWTGGWFPRATIHRNVAVLQYYRRSIPLADDLFFTDYTHAFFPVAGFDQVVQQAGWTFGRKGGSYVALYSQNPTQWVDNEGEPPFELRADGKSNVWICELGCADDNGDFDSFVEQIAAAPLSVGAWTVFYESPSIGEVNVSWDGPMLVEGNPIDLGPFKRWDNKYSSHEFDTNPTRIEFDGQRLELDFDEPYRKYWLEY
ncbi:MAG: hypothetical protein P9M14_05595 [Candidatus Alcyoniella australis]|nr:hypothetical protein [Candidatus Alcyoniella australis]